MSSPPSTSPSLKFLASACFFHMLAMSVFLPTSMIQIVWWSFLGTSVLTGLLHGVLGSCDTVPGLRFLSQSGFLQEHLILLVQSLCVIYTFLLLEEEFVSANWPGYTYGYASGFLRATFRGTVPYQADGLRGAMGTSDSVLEIGRFPRLRSDDLPSR